MPSFTIRAGDAPEVEALLTARIYEYNAAVTGCHDGESFSAVREDAAGVVEAGVAGYTWGGCCFVTHLWVAAALRRQGFGGALLAAVEQHARARRCRLVLLSSHSFQAPPFYARRGFVPVARVEDHPVGHADIFYAKRLDPAPA